MNIMLRNNKSGNRLIKKFAFQVIILACLSSCGIMHYNNPYNIKGKYDILIYGDYENLYNVIDINLDDSSMIEGFVYSKYDSLFMTEAMVSIPSLERSCQVDKKGFFQFVVSPGAYNVEVFDEGNTPLRTRKIVIKKNERKGILIKLGTTIQN